MGNQQTVLNKINFEDMRSVIEKKSDNYILINTLPVNDQTCLIPTTTKIELEETIINKNIDNQKVHIIIYGKNTNDNTVLNRYKQLLALGFLHIYVYPGGIFEWLCLQDIYGSDIFPTTTQQMDILKFKPSSALIAKKLIEN